MSSRKPAAFKRRQVGGPPRDEPWGWMAVKLAAIRRVARRLDQSAAASRFSRN